ncbi:hypothetical protein GLOIN_2v1765060 [Rhizophagus irregularis DAOM 181602=DAOM 197198]|uniref:Uncharacterized protein n=1 Tax=Rhizophagus irregularis (strain DAOM 181602 / DAOM 197198 / MUCL 43194) TaxID=747089 RepID=A0A2P4QR17_RHIID|nr:hypothetical protein GLOIN_2v1765060 [Rhizophagus irregularis DAOM 181602=DAOM 197198]POG80008.1 hypothetical protein GLOIN_2v1765060 [Rhizophagus irregularis DAOM 181602=DAOM 197198]|eukprot:XP_025186874.1 hypothetical protein GLOIN_2v1765060 [Rhizophagus irregularis DAOM 181602=DAOM 197198]
MSDDEIDEGYNEFIKENQDMNGIIKGILNSHQNEIKVENNADEIKRYNDVIKFCKNHLRKVFHKELSPESQRYIARFGCYYDYDLDPNKIVETLIQAKKKNVPDFITTFSNYFRQANNVQILTQSGFFNNNFISAFLNLELTRPL